MRPRNMHAGQYVARTGLHPVLLFFSVVIDSAVLCLSRMAQRPTR
jgi:hypothetical protein